MSNLTRFLACSEPPPTKEQRAGQVRAVWDEQGASDGTAVSCADATAPFPFPSTADDRNKEPTDEEERGSRRSSRSTDVPSSRASERDADVACHETSDGRVGVVGLPVAVGGSGTPR